MQMLRNCRFISEKILCSYHDLFIYSLKTGALLEAAFMAGALLAGADSATVGKFEEAG